MYSIGGGRPLTLRAAADAVRRVLPSARIEVGPGIAAAPDGQAHHPPLDISRAKAEIGYEPQFTLDQGIADCARELAAVMKAASTAET